MVENLFVANTVSTFEVSDRTTIPDISEWLRPYLGQRLVAKPTHSSGTILFLHREVTQEALADFLRRSKETLFPVFRETQYIGLKKKIIVEENIGTGEELADYKFHCIRGQAEYLQIDSDRFTGHKRSIFELPSLEKLDVRFGAYPMGDVPPPENIRDMIVVAERLSRHFESVRVDLYSVEGRIYFGEFTLNPGAAMDRISDEAWGRAFLGKIQRAAIEVRSERDSPPRA